MIYLFQKNRPPLLFGLVLILFALESHGEIKSNASDSKHFPKVFMKLDANAKQIIRNLPSEQSDWFFQDFGDKLPVLFNQKDGEDFLPVIHAIARQVNEISNQQHSIIKDIQQGSFKEKMDLYIQLCKKRRKLRLKRLITMSPQLLFLENTEFGNAPRLNMSMVDGPYKGKPFKAGASIHMLKIAENGETTSSVILNNKDGMLRDLDVSFDGKKILFSQKENFSTDWQISEMEVHTGNTRKITNEAGIANIQPCYLPDGILFHSTRCVTVVDCNESIDAVNIYRCDRDGKNIRRLTNDQVSTQFPALLPDGRIIYTRWEYNDRGQIFPQALFTMYPDGTRQTAFYGNNSWYPTSLIQARGIEGSKKVLAVLAGHHTEPMGKLALIDISAGQEEGAGIELIAPIQQPGYKRVDKAEQDDVLFQYPYPVSPDEYLVGFSLYGKKKSKHFGIYWINKAGERELLAGNTKSVFRCPTPLASRPLPRIIPSMVDYSNKTGTFHISNIYYGPGLKDVVPGTVKSLRVIALDFRSSGIRTNDNCGEGGNARVTTPISVGGSWDTKTILGDAKVYEDGSCYFEVPAYTPVYFQAIDKNGEAIQSMRSWSTLMPGESFSCVGCHESKLTAPANTFGKSMALKAGLKSLTPFYDVKKGFSYPRVIQPILDKHCIKCHNGESIRETIHAANSKAPAYGLFTAYLANADELSCTYEVPKKSEIKSIVFTWGEQIPKTWRLSYLKDDEWIPVSQHSIQTTQNIQTLNVSDLYARNFKLDVVPEEKAFQLLNLQFINHKKDEISWKSSGQAFNLTGTTVDEPVSGRSWSESYLRLIGANFPGSKNVLNATPNDLTNWISPQSRPTMLNPYETGSSQSRLINMLENGHQNTKLNQEELDKLRTWIDLAVPFCGSYDERNNWSDREKQWFIHQNKKRQNLATHFEKQISQ